MTAQQKIEAKLVSILINCASWDERQDIEATYVSVFNEYVDYRYPAEEAASLALAAVRELHNV